MDKYHETTPPTKLKSAVMGGAKSNRSRLKPPHGPPFKPLEQDFQPTSQQVDLMDLRSMKDCIELAREYAHEVLSDHDTRLGRTTRSNKITAEGIEADIRMITKTLDRANLTIQ